MYATDDLGLILLVRPETNSSAFWLRFDDLSFADIVRHGTMWSDAVISHTAG